MDKVHIDYFLNYWNVKQSNYFHYTGHNSSCCSL